MGKDPSSTPPKHLGSAEFFRVLLSLSGKSQHLRISGTVPDFLTLVLGH